MCNLLNKCVSFFRFFWQLTITHELYASGKYNNSLKEVESVVQHLKICTFNKPDNLYTDVYNHIANPTYVYINLTLNREPEMVNL